MISSDNSTRVGSTMGPGSGPGSAFTFECMPCKGRFFSMRGAGRRTGKGVRQALFCATCNAAWHERQKAKVAA